jgi:serine/threonine-protein kinase PknK
MVDAQLSSELAPPAYQLLSLAGSGGAGEVWRATRCSDQATVALKLSRADGGGSIPLSREAVHAALALSPRLPELLDVGWAIVDGGVARAFTLSDRGAAHRARAFLALRWVDGTPLGPSRLPEDRRISLALATARDVGEALADLHGIGIAHGDIKPDNLILDSTGMVHVIDLGLAGPVHGSSIPGATLRYLARHDADLGDTRARDLVALGAVLAEIADPSVAAAEDPIAAARRIHLPPPIDALCAALLAPNPGARPSASWVAETARAHLGDRTGARPAADRGERDARQVRATYLRLRRDELHSAAAAREDTAPWLAEAVTRARRARAIEGAPGMAGAPVRGPILTPLPPEQLARWLTALVGSPAATWPLGELAAAPERALAVALTDLARRLPPPAWSFSDVEAAVLGRGCERAARSYARLRGEPLDASAAAELALAIARVPPDPLALEQIEQIPDAPPALVLAAADALRLRGDYGRARSLILRESARADRNDGSSVATMDNNPRAEGQPAPAWRALAAEILRRAGDITLAEATARRAIETDADEGGRARAVLGRIELDRGQIDEAARLTAEVAALVAAARGDAKRALEQVTRGEALAATAEERARIAAVRGYVSHGSEPAETYAAFAAAVDYAVRSGAVVEEATYRTGEAAAAVSVGELGVAIATARRAALLWEHLGRPSLAARALLAAAAAYATAGAAHETARAAHEAMARARDGGDRRAEAYAFWAIADVSPPGDPEGRAAAERAAALLEGEGAEDALRAAARVLRHGGAAIDWRRIAEIDRMASVDGGLAADARLDWWGARAVRLLDPSEIAASEGEREGSRLAVLEAISTLAEERAPIATRGLALAAGHALAALEGRGDTAQRLLAALGETARELLRRAPPELAPAIRALPWVARAAIAPDDAIRPEQARDLEVLIRSFSDRERLGPLLNRIVDALVLWTSVERGLLLLRAPGGRLVPRAARNLARADLTDEQMALSQTLARRALEAREPVIAVDAAGELPSVHQSVHALKLRSVLAVPLIARGEPLGVAYLDDRVRRGAFGPREISFARSIASLAAMAIADARDQALLRRVARRERRASAEIAETLSLREAALDVAERELRKARGERDTRFQYDEIVGASAPIQRLLKLVDRVTAADVPVLIGGESGSGKELIARAIHKNGPRKGRPFVSENCGAIPEGLLESTLFGHVRGAFTGASLSRAGLFEVAHHGTLFLDEIGEMSLGMQTKLLRVLEDGMVRPVGAERERKVDVRVIAATNRDLAAMVKGKAFREDLFYRLNIIAIRVPSLRERAEDVPLIVRHLIEKHSAGGRVRVSPPAMDRLMAFHWPGNVRQLENEIRRALVLSDGLIDEEHLSAEITFGEMPASREIGLHVRRRIDALERGLVREALERTLGNQTQAAKLLGLSRFGLQKMIKRLSIS